ncbi:MAG: pyridoxamine 5'-phosphate oxidase family protein [Thermodesulfobacteriota bacterium]
MALAAEVEAFLAASMVARVATRSPRGRPFVTPLWFVASGGRLYLATGRGTRAARNASRDPHVVLLLDGELAKGARRVLRVRGTATVHDGMPPLHVLLLLARKYYLTIDALASELRHAAQWALRLRYYAQSTAAYLEIVPESAELLAAPG